MWLLFGVFFGHFYVILVMVFYNFILCLMAICTKQVKISQRKTQKKKQTKKLVHSCCYVLHFKYIYTRTRYDIETIYFLIFSWSNLNFNNLVFGKWSLLDKILNALIKLSQFYVVIDCCHLVRKWKLINFLNNL